MVFHVQTMTTFDSFNRVGNITFKSAAIVSAVVTNCNESSVYYSCSNIVSHFDVLARWISSIVSTNRETTSFIDSLITTFQSSSINYTCHNVIVDCDISWSCNSDSNWPELEENVVLNMDICRGLDIKSPCITIVNGRVSNWAMKSCCRLKPDRCFESVYLRAIENFNAIHHSCACTSNDFCSINLHGITGDDLTTPTFNVLGINFNISCQKNDLTSHIKTVI